MSKIPSFFRKTPMSTIVPQEKRSKGLPKDLEHTRPFAQGGCENEESISLYRGYVALECRYESGPGGGGHCGKALTTGKVGRSVASRQARPIRAGKSVHSSQRPGHSAVRIGCRRLLR